MILKVYDTDKTIENRRSKILELLEAHPHHMLKFSKEFLESVIFLKLKDLTGSIIKFPVWTGSFLNRIDLSEVDFNDVFWDANNEELNNIVHLTDLNKLNTIINEEEELEYAIPFVNYDEEKYLIDFSNTNAKIDFSKRNKFNLVINSCNFENTDLSKSSLGVFATYYNNSFKNTKIDFHDLLDAQELYKDIVSLGYNNFSYNDLSHVILKAENLNATLASYTNNAFIDLSNNFLETNIKVFKDGMITSLIGEYIYNKKPFEPTIIVNENYTKYKK